MGFLIALVLGLAVGSFLNVVIYRLPVMMENSARREAKLFLGIELDDKDSAVFNLSRPSSHCPHCHHSIRPLSNIPILSFLWQKGRCKNCQAPISWRYPSIEMLTALLFIACYWRFGDTVVTALACLFCAFSVALFFIDADSQLLPDNLTLSLLWLGLLANVFGLFTSLPDAVIAAAVGYMFFWLIFQIFKLITGKEGMGYGDFKLLAALGAWFGLTALPLIILISSIVGLLTALLILRLAPGKPTPFGPYLIVAGLLMLLMNQEMQNLATWWLKLSGF